MRRGKIRITRQMLENIFKTFYVYGDLEIYNMEWEPKRECLSLYVTGKNIPEVPEGGEITDIRLERR